MFSRIKTLPLGWVIYGLLTFFLVAVEAAYFFPEDWALKKYLALGWIVVSVGLLATIWVVGLAPFFQREFWSTPFRTWYLIAAFLPAALILFNIGGITFNRVDTESTLQQADALYMLDNRNSLGIYDMAFLGGTYPNRQYTLACLPSYFFGRSIIDYRIGYALLYLGAYFAFLAGIKSYLQSRSAWDPLLLASFAGVTVILGNYTMIAARLFEQLIMPLTTTMLFLSGVLFYLSRRTPYFAFWVTWVFGFFPYCYSPSLASWGLAFLVLIYLIVHRHFALGAALGYGLCALACAYLLQHQNPDLLKAKFQIGQFSNFGPFDWVWRWIKAFRAVVGPEECLIPPPLLLGIGAGLFLSWRHRDYRFPVVCLWALGTMGAAIAFQGFCWRTPESDISRSMGTLPALSLGVILCLTFFAAPYFHFTLPQKAISFILVASIIWMVISSVTTPFLRRQIRDNPPDEQADSDESALMISKIVNDPHAAPIKKIYLIPPLDIQVEDALLYFSPGTVVIRGVPPAGEKTPGNYLMLFRSENPDDRNWISGTPSLHPRPYLKLIPE